MTDAGVLLFVHGGCTFTVADGVQPPKPGSLLFCRHLPVRAGDRMLEIGTGIGLAAVLAARAGARVVATDVVDAAVRGEVRGDLVASRTAVLHDGARVIGNIRAPKIVVEEGARFSGAIEMEVELPQGVRGGA